MFHTGLGQFLPFLMYLLILGACAVSLAQPRIGVYVLALTLPLASGRQHIVQYLLGAHVHDLLLVCVLVGAALSPDLSVKPPKQLRIVILALCATLYVTLWIGPMLNSDVPMPLRTSAADGFHTPFGFFMMFMRMPVLYFAVCASMKTRGQVKILLLVMMIAFLWNAKNFYGNVGGRETSQFSENLRNSMGQDFGGSNGRAAYSAQCTLFLIALFGTIKSLRVRVFAAALIAVGIYCVIFAYSRGAYAAFILGLAYLGIFRMRWLLPVIAAVLIFATALLPDAVTQRVEMTYSNGQLDTSSELRLAVWSYALHLTASDPILGVGFDSFRFYPVPGGLKDTHNVYLKTLVETGVIGLGCMIGLLFSAFIAGHRLSRNGLDEFDRALGSGLAALIVAVIVANIFGDRWTYLELSTNTWILMALVVLVTQWNKDPAAMEAPKTATPIPLWQAPIRKDPQVPRLVAPSAGFREIPR